MSIPSVLDRLIAPVDEKNVQWQDIARIALIASVPFLFRWSDGLHWAYRIAVGWACLVLLIVMWSSLSGEFDGIQRRWWLRCRLLVAAKLSLVFAPLVVGIELLSPRIRTGVQIAFFTPIALLVLFALYGVLGTWFRRRRSQPGRTP